MKISFALPWGICRDKLCLQIAIAVSAVGGLQLLQTCQQLWIANNLPSATILAHVSQMPIGIDDKGSHGGDWRFVDGDAPFIPPSLHPLSAQTQSHDQTEQGWLAARALFLYEGCDELEAFQTRD